MFEFTTRQRLQAFGARLMIASLLCTGAAFVSGCDNNDNVFEDAGDKIDDAMDDAADEIEDVADDLD